MEIKTLTGKRIAIKKGERAIIELNNSLFNTEGQFKGSYSYPVKLALTPETLEAIHFAPNLEKKIRNPLIPVSVYLDGQVFKNSILSLSVNGSEVEGTLQIDLRLINQKIKEYTLDQLPCESFDISTDENSLVTHMKTVVANTNYRIYPYTFLPVKNPLFVGEVPNYPNTVQRKSNSVINEFAITGGTFNYLKSWGGNVGEDLDIEKDLKHKVVYFYLNYVIEKICSFLGYTAKGDFLNHPDIQKIVIDNINEMRAGTTGVSYGTRISADDHLPALSIEDFFKTLIGFFNIRITLNNRKSEIIFSWKKSVLINSVFLDLTKYNYKILQQNYTEPDGYTLISETDKYATDVTDIVDTVIFGNGKKKLEVKAGTLRKDKTLLSGSTTQFYDVLAEERAGNLWDFRSIFSRENSVNTSGVKEFPLRFMFTNGTTVQVAGVNIPSGGIEGNDFTLKFNGNKSLYNYAHQDWLAKTNDAKTVRISILLPITVINKLNDEDVLMLTSESGVTVYALWEKIKFTSVNDASYLNTEMDISLLDSVVTTQRTDDEDFYVRVKISGRFAFSPSETRARIDYEVFKNKDATIPAVGFSLKLETFYTVTKIIYKNYGTTQQTIESQKSIYRDKRLITASYGYVYGFSNVIVYDAGASREENTFEYSIKPRKGYTILPTVEIP